MTGFAYDVNNAIQEKMNKKPGRKYWKLLGITAMFVGFSVIAYVIAVLIKEYDEPLIGVFVLMVGVPAIAPSILGYYMYKGSVTATWALRISIVLILFSGIVLDTVIGLDVLSFAPIAVSLISFCVIWLIVSFL
jgi:hypothetical protein